MGAVLSFTLTSRLDEIARGADSEVVARAAADPNAILDPALREAIPPETLTAMQGALGEGIRYAFGLGAGMVLLAVVASMRLPRERLIGR
jgi:hypothetical protein